MSGTDRMEDLCVNFELSMARITRLDERTNECFIAASSIVGSMVPISVSSALVERTQQDSANRSIDSWATIPTRLPVLGSSSPPDKMTSTPDWPCSWWKVGMP